MYQILFSDEAKFDITEAFLWYESQREGLGMDFELCLEAGIKLIQRTPKIFEYRYKSIRIHFIQRFPYGIHYLVDTDESIKVFAVFHTSKNPSEWNKRLH